ncbi:MAG: YebC/PmpR family DNA-binding transcriptional regulator [Brumimicrobium sp.]
MAGHSKWSTIKRKKGALDAKRSKMFTRVIKEINVAIKEGGSADPDSNPALRNAIANAKGVNMPKDNIDRIIKKASGADAENYEEVTFEGYGPHGIAFFIECTTDNMNRTVANIRAIFNRNEGNLGTNGSLEFLFERKGVFTINKNSISMDLDDLELELIDSGLDSMDTEDEEVIIVYSTFSEFGAMQSALEKLKIEVQSTKLERVPLNTVELPIEQAKKILKLEEKFDDDDDVQNVFHNLEITDELIAEME